MRIGILTQSINYNYGGILQNYALQTVLRRMGHEVETLNWDAYRCEHAHENYFFQLFQVTKIFFSKYILRRKRNFIWEQRRFFYMLSNSNSDFCHKYIVSSNWLWGKKAFRKYTIDKQFDALIVGSDQTWRPAYNKNGMLYRMFLDFTEGVDIKRIAYSASFGVNQWEFNETQTMKCSKLLNIFDSVSVREDSGIVLCANHFGINNVVCTLDPTMLLPKQDYINISNQYDKVSSKEELLVYMLDFTPDKERIVSIISKRKKLNQSMFIVRYCNLGMVDEQEIKDYIIPPVDNWLGAFNNAKYVICDSFHGMVFSIIFNKPFIVLSNRKRGMERFVSLLNKLHLQNRLVEEFSEEVFNVLDTPIDWSQVNEKLNKLRLFSFEFLRLSLEE